jgi:hypothetical protein
VQHAVDPEANPPASPRFHMMSKLEGVLPEPIDDVDDVAVVGIELPCCEHQLLEVAPRPALLLAFFIERVVELAQVPDNRGLAKASHVDRSSLVGPVPDGGWRSRPSGRA